MIRLVFLCRFCRNPSVDSDRIPSRLLLESLRGSSSDSADFFSKILLEFQRVFCLNRPGILLESLQGFHSNPSRDSTRILPGILLALSLSSNSFHGCRLNPSGNLLESPRGFYPNSSGDSARILVRILRETLRSFSSTPSGDCA